MLYEAQFIFEDQVTALRNDSKKMGTQGSAIDFALLVDGLAAEREQGITIDVAYRYFSTSKRKFIVADTPGHEQYTRNMVTGASVADLAIILVNAKKGILPQTLRHSFICSFLGIKNIILVIFGGSNDLIYPIFKSFDSQINKINIVSIDNQFDLYQESDLISGRTYMNKIIVDDSNKLNDFTNIGYQRHLCSNDEIQLMEKLFFEYISLGEISENNMKAEPIMRNANIVGFDTKSLNSQGSPNGIDPRLSCILAKYAGQSNKANFFGLFELNNNAISNKLYSEIICIHQPSSVYFYKVILMI